MPKRERQFHTQAQAVRHRTAPKSLLDRVSIAKAFRMGKVAGALSLRHNLSIL